MKEKCLICYMPMAHSDKHKCKMCGMTVTYNGAEYFMGFVFCSKICRDFFEKAMEKSENVKDLIEREIII